MFSDFDRTAMQRALELAARGLASTHPNPRVGCVIARSGRIVGEGWHARAGEAHAEVMALATAGSEAAGATVYVTLEPCNHQARTPPCVDALLAARVARVVYAVADPNPRVAGRGAARLEVAGVNVAAGLMAAEATELNAGFFKRMRTGRPWVRVKLAMSLDGRTALASGASRWVSGEAARADVQQWRARSAAIMTGVGTVLADDPRLDVRLAEVAEEPPRPLRVVLDSTLRTPPAARLFTVPGEVLIITALSAGATESH
jgi:diaminohydroxyphosphoribosylaminopyrimidine deaminase/5-amino-6-(5-phosphoribosylamino)uracil reductase